MKILAIDPGSTESGFVVFCTTTNKVISFGKIKNADMLAYRNHGSVLNGRHFISRYGLVLIEKPDFIAHGNTNTRFIETIFWAGRFHQAFNGSITYGRNFLKKSYGLKKDSEVITLIKREYPGIKLTLDSWQAMLLVYAYQNGLLEVKVVSKTYKKKNKKIEVIKVKKSKAKEIITTDLELI